MSKQNLTRYISCHAWNKDHTMVALSPNDNEVHIYKAVGEDLTKWEKKYTLEEHSGFVSDIDWSPVTNYIVTCGHDRNAYVWKYEEKDDKWKPTLVILRINRAATSVKWSPQGNKFAVTSGAKCVPICNFEVKNDWWVSKMLKKFKSTVLDVAWCCNNKFVVTGCADNKCRIFSAYIPELDSPENDGFEAIWPKEREFGEVLAEFDARAWVRSVAWAPSGLRLAFSGHGSTVTFVQIVQGDPVVQTVNFSGLPFLAVEFLSDNTLVGAGFDNNPAVFTASGSEGSPQWTFQEFVDKQERKAGVKDQSKFAAAKNLFQDSAKKGISIDDNKMEETVLNTRHQNTINDIAVFNGKTFTTSSIDGTILFWHLDKLGIKVA